MNMETTIMAIIDNIIFDMKFNEILYEDWNKLSDSKKHKLVRCWKNSVRNIIKEQYSE